MDRVSNFRYKSVSASLSSLRGAVLKQKVSLYELKVEPGETNEFDSILRVEHIFEGISILR